MQVIDHLHRRERQAAHEAGLIDLWAGRGSTALEPRRGAFIGPALRPLPLRAERSRLLPGEPLFRSKRPLLQFRRHPEQDQAQFAAIWPDTARCVRHVGIRDHK
jgi:hypothetical protein